MLSLCGDSCHYQICADNHHSPTLVPGIQNQSRVTFYKYAAVSCHSYYSEVGLNKFLLFHLRWSPQVGSVSLSFFSCSNGAVLSTVYGRLDVSVRTCNFLAPTEWQPFEWSIWNFVNLNMSVRSQIVPKMVRLLWLEMVWQVGETIAYVTFPYIPDLLFSEWSHTDEIWTGLHIHNGSKDGVYIQGSALRGSLFYQTSSRGPKSPKTPIFHPNCLFTCKS